MSAFVTFENVGKVYKTGEVSIKAVENVDAPDRRILEKNTLDPHVFAIVEFNISVYEFLIAEIGNALLGRIVEKSVSENADILCTLGVNTAENERIAVNINAFVVVKLDLADKMNTRAEIVRNLGRTGLRDRL